MTKRKSKPLKIRPKKTTRNTPLPKTNFDCIYCDTKGRVVVKMLTKIGVGRLGCELCGAGHEVEIHHLSDPVDVYSSWLDTRDHNERGDETEQQREERLEKEMKQEKDTKHKFGFKKRGRSLEREVVTDKKGRTVEHPEFESVMSYERRKELNLLTKEELEKEEEMEEEMGRKGRGKERGKEKRKERDVVELSSDEDEDEWFGRNYHRN